MSQPAYTAQNWLGKTISGVVLGFTLALGLSGIFRLSGGAGQDFFSTRGQVSMWMIAPIWTLIIACVFMFRTTARAWGWLLLINIILWGGIFLSGKAML